MLNHSKYFSLLMLLVGMMGCSSPAIPTIDTPASTPPTGAITPSSASPSPISTHTLAPSWTPLPSKTLPPALTVEPPASTVIDPTDTTPSPSPTLLLGWRVYENNYLGYTIQYPVGANIHTVGFNSLPDNVEIPPDFTMDSYFTYLEEILPGNLCVMISTSGGLLAITPPLGFVEPCPGLGVGNQYRIEDTSQVFTIGNEKYPVVGKRLILSATNTFKSDIFIIRLKNRFMVTLVTGPSEGMDEAAYLRQQDELLSALSSLSWVREPDLTIPGWSCAGAFTRLLPGLFARVSAENASPNRVRSGPDITDKVIAQIYPGTPFQLVAGPVCSSGLVFWQISHPSISGEIGWTAEGDGKAYYLEPYNP